MMKWLLNIAHILAMGDPAYVASNEKYEMWKK